MQGCYVFYEGSHNLCLYTAFGIFIALFGNLAISARLSWNNNFQTWLKLLKILDHAPRML